MGLWCRRGDKQHIPALAAYLEPLAYRDRRRLSSFPFSRAGKEVVVILTTMYSEVIHNLRSIIYCPAQSLWQSRVQRSSDRWRN